MLNEEVTEDVEPIEEKTHKWSKKKITIILLLTFLLSAGLGIGSHFAFSPIVKNHKAQSVLNSIGLNSGTITPVNVQITTFKGQTISNANVDQKALTGGTSNESAVFIFNNGKSVEGRKTLDIYIDFSSQTSRDFILLNQSSLKGMVESGQVELRIHPVPSGSAFSMYAPEALAESFVTKPKASWNFMLDLLKLSAVLDTNQNDDILESIVKTASDNGLTDIDSASISNGTFASWILAVGDDKNLTTGYYPPIVYVNGSEISPDTINFNNTDAFKRAVLK